jgi:integrase
VARAQEWIARHSLPLADAVRPENLRRALGAISRKFDGAEAAENTIRRKRMVFNNALAYAVTTDRLKANPLPKADWQAPLTDTEVDFRYVPGPHLARDLITAVGAQGPRGAHLKAFFGCLYYAAMRPGETAALADHDCLLPDPQAEPDGWGELVLARSNPEAGSGWTDDGRPHDTRGLKRRARNARRSIPIPPDLVHLLHAHLERYGTAPDGRLFRAVRGGRVTSTEYSRLWATARRDALHPRDADTPLAQVPYSLRHAGISLWITAGIPPTEAARRAGHSLTVLYTASTPSPSAATSTTPMNSSRRPCKRAMDDFRERGLNCPATARWRHAAAAVGRRLTGPLSAGGCWGRAAATGASRLSPTSRRPQGAGAGCGVDGAG